MRKKFLSLLLVFAMSLSLMPATVWAVEGEEEGDGGDPAPPPTNDVAQVGNTKYPTLEAAIDAAGNGATVTLLDSYNTTNSISIRRPMTLDLGGRRLTFSGDGSLTIGATVTIKNGEIDQTQGTKFSAVQVSGLNGKLTVGDGCVINSKYCGVFLISLATLTVTGGTIEGYAGIIVRDGSLTVESGFISASAISKDATVTVTVGEADQTAEIPAAAIAIDKSETINSIKVTISGGKIYAENKKALNYTEDGVEIKDITDFDDVDKVEFDITGGAFNSDLTLDNGSEENKSPFLNEPWTTEYNNAGLYFVVNKNSEFGKNVATVTSVNEETCYYTALKSAIEAAQNGLGRTVTLLDDFRPTEDYFPIINEDLTIELDGHDLDLRNGFITVNGAELTIINKQPEKSNSGVTSRGTQTVVVQDYIDAYTGELISNGKLVVGDGGSVKNYGTNSVAVRIEGESEASIAGGTVQAAGTGVYIVKDGELTVDAGVLESTGNCAVYQPQGGKITINGGEVTGKAGIVSRGGSINVAGGIIKANGSSNVRVGNGDLQPSSVRPAGIVICEPGSDDDNVNISPVFKMSGGEVFASGADAIVYYDENGEISQEPLNEMPYATFGIETGSIFSSDVTGFLDEKHMVIKNGGKFYVTDVGEAVVFTDDGSFKVYTTLQEAIDAINNGDIEGNSVVLARDVDDAESITVSKDIDLELNGHSINFKAGHSLELQADVTITGGSITQAGNEEDSSPVKVSGGTVTLVDVEITGGANGVEVIDGQLIVKDGTRIKGDENGILVSGGKVTIGEANGDNSKIEISGPTAVHFKGGSGEIHSGTFQSTDKDGVSVKVDGSDGPKEFIYGGTFHNSAGGKDPVPNEYLAEDTIQYEDGTVEYLPGRVITITFDPNGGSLAADIDDTAKIIKDEQIGKTVDKLPEPTRTGYRFDGWYTKQEDGTLVTTKTIFKDADITGAAMTVYAHWKKVHTVTFDPNGGRFEPDAGSTQVQVVEGGVLSKDRWPKAPTLGGYRFDSWYTEPADGNGSPIGDTYRVEQDTTVYAHWIKTAPYDITFHANGGTFLPSGAVEMTIQTDEEGNMIDWPDNPYREGYSFDDWYTAPDSGKLFNASYVIEHDTMVYAHWKKVHTVTFDPTEGEFKYDGGSSKDPVRVQVVAGSTLPKNQWPKNPTREGYNFTAWYTAKDGGVAFSDAYTINNDTTLYARWEKTAPYTITFDPNGGSFNGDTNPMTMLTDNNGRLSELPASPTRAGSTFGGWYTENGIRVTLSTKFMEDTTVYAHWIYTVTFDATNGAFTDGAKTKTETTNEDGRLSKWPSSPVLDGHNFGGWYTERTGGTRVNDSNNPYKFTKDTTVYAQWTKIVMKEFTVTFDANGGKFTDGTETKTATTTGGKLAPDAIPTPTRDGYTFIAWYTEAKGGDKIDTDKPFTQDTTLYAHWRDDSPGGPDKPDIPGEIDKPEPEPKRYRIIIDPGIVHGSVTLDEDREYAEKGTTVWLTVTPHSDYLVTWVKAVSEDGSLDQSLSVSRSGGQCSFIMPDSDVTVSAQFSLTGEYNTFIPPQTRPQSSEQASLSKLVFTPITWRPAASLWDIPTSSWAYSAAQWAYQNGYLDLSVDGTFRLSDTVSHIQMWRIMARWLGETQLDNTSVSQWARKNGASNTGAASAAMTRQNMVEYLYRCYYLMGGDTSVSGDLLQYLDGQQIMATSAGNAWLWAVNKGIISGTTDGHLNPNGILNRGEFAVILMRLCQKG